LKSVIGSGFGHFSRVSGPNGFYFPPLGGFPFVNQFGAAIGTTIQGGAHGATITSLTIEPPFNLPNSFSSGAFWRFTVVRGPIPPSLRGISNTWQDAGGGSGAGKGYPLVGDNDQELPVLWSKIFFSNNVSDTGDAQAQAQATHFPFEDMSGPSVGPGEAMTVFIAYMNSSTGGGTTNWTYMAMTVCGVYKQRLAGRGNNIDQTARSIPRGRVGGL
jgi:hypothetical protein